MSRKGLELDNERGKKAVSISIVLAGFLCVLSCGGVTFAGTYADSAHGNATYGVDRPGTECPTGTPCPQGDCTHCHDTFDDSICGVNQRMLFYSTQTVCDMICYECHGASYASEQQVINYPYGVLFGGLSTFYFESILHQFCAQQTYHSNCGSRHSLARIYNTIKDNGYGWGFSSNPNPCSACHNPHLAQRIGSTQHRPPYDPSKSPITRPSEHYNNPGNLWGDDGSERMDQYVLQFTDGVYQAPYYGDISDPGWELAYEPEGNVTSDGSNLPDYVTFCLDCHQYQQYDPENGQNVKAIDYANERHGGYPANDCTYPEWDEGWVRPPYSEFSGSNYVLSCLDCHEPHGTKNRRHLIRRMINGQEVALDTKDKWGNCYNDFGVICEKCHAFDYDHLSWGGCTGCHGSHNSGDWHGSKFEFPSTPETCKDKPSF